MKVDEYGIICDAELAEEINKLAERFGELTEKLSPVECLVLQCHLMSSVGFIVSVKSVKKRIKDLQGDSPK